MDWLLRAPYWPVGAGVLLGATAMVEVALVSDTTVRPLVLILGLGATVPLALGRVHPGAAAGLLAMATAAALVSDQRLVVAGLVALVAGFHQLGSARRRHSDRLEHDASRRAVAESLLAHAARGERARIARELHDVVAHHISVIAVQAETARLTTPGLPVEGASRLVAIGDTARDALTEMRRLLGVLREDTEAVVTRRPQPGIAQLNELLDEARQATRTSTRLIVRGQVAPLDPGVELAVYRIVQEALTNTRRHAPHAAVDVELEYTDADLRLRIRDNGPGPAGDGGAVAGLGILGMRERAAAVGGEVWTGLSPTAGFLVEARLPRGGHDR